MKYVVIYEGTTDMNRVRELFPAHRAAWHKFQESGDLIAIGPFADPTQGALSIFKTREAAEEFVRNDPFVTNHVVGKWEIREWREALLP